MIVFVSESERDGHSLQQIASRIAHSVVRVCHIDAVREQIRESRPSLVIWDADVAGDWRELLDGAESAGFPLIIASRLATESLWAEVLNLGGCDVLELPFDRDELERVVSAALGHGGGRAAP